MKLALSLLTCDKLELVEQSIKPLLTGAADQKFHLFIVDGSANFDNEQAIWKMAYPTAVMTANIRGGAGNAIVYALTAMLNHPEEYTHVGLVESDVLLLDGWLDVLGLFSRGKTDGLSVGAASARCFVDRVLFQRETCAVMHNTGAGMIIFTRQAAKIVLDTFRTPWTSDNRRIFMQLCGVDIGAFWAFRLNEHFLTADWGWDAALAAHGLASLALTPSPVEMIGQNPPLAEQGLTIATGEVIERWSNDAFQRYVDSLDDVREGRLQLGVDPKFHLDAANGTQTIFPHQIQMVGGSYSGDWKLKEVRGFGTFGWVAGDRASDEKIIVQEIKIEFDNPTVTVPVFGSCSILVSGGKNGGKVEVVDEGSGFTASPEMPPEGDATQVLQLMVPAGIAYRNIRITALSAGVIFYGLQTREKQPFLPNVSFDHSVLPPA